MIKVQSLTIKKFRGIKELTIPFDGKSWVIHGRNGSGKSGVIDALEFALSGEIGRLTGEGRGDVSVKVHGPHVDFKDSPKEAVVEADIKLNDDKTLKVSRDCSSASKCKFTPSKGEAVDKFSSYSIGRELVLSRREILKFVLSEPGKRSKEVQTLLQIDKIDEIRSAFLTVKNKAERLFSSEKQEFERNKAKLKEWLEVEELNKESILKVVNKHRKTLGLEEFIDFEDSSVLLDGVKNEGDLKVFLNKTELQKDVASVENFLTTNIEKYQLKASEFKTTYSSLSGKKEELQKLSRLNFYTAGLTLISDNECPFCESDWDDKDLQEIIREKIAELSGLKTIQSRLGVLIFDTQTVLRELKTLLSNFKLKTSKLDSVKSSEIDNAIEEIQSLLEIKNEDFESFNIAVKKSSNSYGISNLDLVNKELYSIKGLINKLPEKSNEDKAKDFLVICQERLNNYRESKRKYLHHQKKHETASSMLDHFNTVVEGKLNALYEDVQKDFSRFYQIVNHDDEASFGGELIADKGALDFKVNFYDRGKFPPAAYHSEGHQDGMGLCLYLALMKKILGQNFTLAILDDVLMSVDSEHRKSFCKLLKTEFSNTQFIITTHDEYWKKQMITEGLVNHSTSLLFKNWTVDTGPTVWDEKDSWTEIDLFIQQENVPSAAHSLRRFLEYFMDEMSIILGASIQRSASGDHDLGELLSGVTSRYGDLLKRAKTSARSWGNSELESKIEEEKKTFDDVLKKAKSEMWAINGSVHFNSWMDMGKKDFETIVVAYKELINHLKCTKCNRLLHAVPLKGGAETLKCDCGVRTYNLKTKN